MAINDEDVEGFAYYQTHLGEDNVGFYEEQLKRDYRKSTIKGDIIERYDDFIKWRNSILANDVNKTIDLIPEEGEVSVRNLRDASTSRYSMSDFCIPSPPPDLNCADINHKNFKVLPPDPHHLDGDKDGVGCES